MISAAESKRAILAIHRAIASKRDDAFVFIGGGIVPLLITDPAAPASRPTKDVDVVFEVVSPSLYSMLRRDLLNVGFKDDLTADKPACTLFFQDWRVDILPTKPNIVFGGGNRWFDHVIQSAEEIELDGDIVLRASAPVFIATKLEAWLSRGRTKAGGPDYFHQDLEDIIAVIDGRPEIDSEWSSTPADALEFVVAMFTRFLGSGDFLNALPGHLSGDDARALIWIDRLKERLLSRF
jgi:hypothetical protein